MNGLSLPLVELGNISQPRNAYYIWTCWFFNALCPWKSWNSKLRWKWLNIKYYALGVSWYISLPYSTRAISGAFNFRGGSTWPPSNFKTTYAIDMKCWPEIDNYDKFQFDLSLENLILLFVSNDVIKFKTMENDRIFNKSIL